MDTPRKSATFSARIAPAAGLDVLSRHEVARLRDAGGGGLHELLRRCALAVLTQGSATDDARALLERYPDFEIQILQQDRGVKLELNNAPAEAFVDGRIIRGINELLFAVVRDIVYVATQIEAGRFDLFELARDHARGVRNPAQRARAARERRSESRRVLGRPFDLCATSTNTPRRSATSSACARSTSAPAADPAR